MASVSWDLLNASNRGQPPFPAELKEGGGGLEFFVRERLRHLMDYPERYDHYEFPPLPKKVRANIHTLAKKYGGESASQGSKANRRVFIRAKKGSNRHDLSETLIAQSSVISLSEKAKKALDDYLTRHPPTTETTNGTIEPENAIASTADQAALRQSTVSQLWRRNPLVAPSVVVPSSSAAHALDRQRRALPAFRQRDAILRTIADHDVILISGGTGCGKTTQIPQYVLEASASQGMPVRVVCTQPRRLPAIAVARRVADERRERLGDTVGYHIRLESRVSPRTILTYCTSGVLVRTLCDDALDDITHVFLDEIHEREIETDFLLTVLKRLSERRRFKLILMSATMGDSCQLFMDYFPGAVHLQIPEKLYEVETFDLVDVLRMTDAPVADKEDRFGGVFGGSVTVDEAPLEVGVWDGSELQTQMNVSGDSREGSSTAKPDGDVACAAIQPFAELQLSSPNGTTEREKRSTEIDSGDRDATRESRESAYLTSLPADRLINDDCISLPDSGDEHERHEDELDKEQCCAAAALTVMNGVGDAEEPLKEEEEHGRCFDPQTAWRSRRRFAHVSDDQMCEYYESWRLTGAEQADLALAHRLITYLMDSPVEGSILVFLPGYEDICRLTSLIELSGWTEFRMQPLLFALHSQMDTRDQAAALLRAPTNKRKVILSTNIAEASITIDDVVFVIDCGLIKEKRHYYKGGFSVLQTVPISKSSAEQRRGRAGRCRKGFCFRLYRKEQWAEMAESQTPEILRSTIHEVCMQAKMMLPSNVDVGEFLASAPQPPDVAHVEQSMRFLQELGAVDASGALTAVGRTMGGFPLDPQHSRLLLYAVSLRCLDPILTLVAALNHRSPFLLGKKEEKEDRLGSRDSLARLDLSDHIVLIRVFLAYRDADGAKRDDFCRRLFLSANSMRMIDGIRGQLIRELRRCGLLSPVGATDGRSWRTLNRLSACWPIVRAAIVAGCYPNIAFVPAGGKMAGLKTGTGETNVGVHPGSVVKRMRQWQADSSADDEWKRANCDAKFAYIAYQELVRLEHGLVAKEVTCVSPLVAYLFSAPWSDEESPAKKHAMEKEQNGNQDLNDDNPFALVDELAEEETTDFFGVSHRFVAVRESVAFNINTEILDGLAVIRSRLKSLCKEELLHADGQLHDDLVWLLKTLLECDHKERGFAPVSDICDSFGRRPIMVQSHISGHNGRTYTAAQRQNGSSRSSAVVNRCSQIQQPQENWDTEDWDTQRSYGNGKRRGFAKSKFGGRAAAASSSGWSNGGGEGDYQRQQMRTYPQQRHYNQPTHSPQQQWWTADTRYSPPMPMVVEQNYYPSTSQAYGVYPAPAGYYRPSYNYHAQSVMPGRGLLQQQPVMTRPPHPPSSNYKQRYAEPQTSAYGYNQQQTQERVVSISGHPGKVRTASPSYYPSTAASSHDYNWRDRGRGRQHRYY